MSEETIYDVLGDLMIDAEFLQDRFEQLTAIENENREMNPELLDELQAMDEFICDIPESGMLIHENHFTDYAQELAEEAGHSLDAWPMTAIDWEDAAQELLHDYTVVELGEDTYYYNG